MKKPQRKQLVPRPPVNISVNGLRTITNSQIIHTLLTAKAPLIRTLIHSSDELTFFKAWWNLGKAKQLHKTDGKYIVPKHLWYTLSPQGLLAMLAHTFGREKKSFAAFEVFVRKTLRTHQQLAASTPRGTAQGHETHSSTVQPTTHWHD